jgi:hypothetical protein
MIYTYISHLVAILANAKREKVQTVKVERKPL